MTLADYTYRPSKSALRRDAGLSRPRLHQISINRGSKRAVNIRYTRAIYRKSLRDIFETRIREWLRDSEWRSISFSTHHKQFAALVSMGAPILPLVLEKLSDPDVRPLWFPLLKDLAGGQDPVPEQFRGQIAEMARHWLAWGRRNNFIEE